ncbi:MAG: BON domain-containing protein [Acidobacteria bacterium]|nr:BON domain-containing protein [Acidobacteriota bacterium]
MKRILTLLILLLAAAFTSAAQKQPPTDDEIYDRVRLQLSGDAEVKGGAFEVIVKDGVVTIRGKVEKEKYKSKAERLAKKVKGVKQVVNELRVG